jgi:hypothetical protein
MAIYTKPKYPTSKKDLTKKELDRFRVLCDIYEWQYSARPYFSISSMYNYALRKIGEERTNWGELYYKPKEIEV